MAEQNFSTIDPNTCSIEELEREIARMANLVGYYETKQLALKQFINSVYGATASQYFIAHNVLVAESITLQGQDLNHFSENMVNNYFKGIFQNDTELHKELGIRTEDAMKVKIDAGRVTPMKPLTGPEFGYLKGDTVSMTVAGDTDSVSEDTLVYVDGEKMTVAEMFERMKLENGDVVMRISDGSEVVPCSNHTTRTYADGEAVDRPVNYVMRHRVSKPRYRITSESGRSVVVTGDHSCMVMRDGKLISVKACEINKETDKLVVA